MWPISVVAHEIASQLRAERWRGVVIVLIILALTCAVVAVELGQVQRAIDAEDEVTAAGTNVFVALPATEATQIEASRCVALNANSMVLAAGGFAGDEAVGLAKAPGERLALRGITGRMAQVLTGTDGPPATGLLIPASEAGRLGLTAGPPLVFAGDRGSTELSVIDLSARLPDSGAWVLNVVPPLGELTSCWAEFHPAATPFAEQVMRSWLMTGSGEILVQRHLREGRFQTSAVEVFNARANAFAWAPAGIAAGLILVLMVWFRRAETALYRTVGASWSATALIYAGHYAVVLGLGVTAGTLVGAWIFGLSGDLSVERFLGALRQGGLVGATAMLVLGSAALIVAKGRTSTFIRERL